AQAALGNCGGRGPALRRATDAGRYPSGTGFSPGCAHGRCPDFVVTPARHIQSTYGAVGSAFASCDSRSWVCPGVRFRRGAVERCGSSEGWRQDFCPAGKRYGDRDRRPSTTRVAMWGGRPRPPLLTWTSSIELTRILRVYPGPSKSKSKAADKSVRPTQTHLYKAFTSIKIAGIA